LIMSAGATQSSTLSLHDALPILVLCHCPLVQRAACASRPASTVGKDAGAILDLGFQGGFWLAIIVVEFIPDQPGFNLKWVFCSQEGIHVCWTVLPIFRGHLCHGIVELIAVGLISHECAVTTTAHIGVGRVDAEAAIGTELTG